MKLRETSEEDSRRVGSATGVERHADSTSLRLEKETCHEGSDSSCEQWQLTVGRQPCSCTPTQQNSKTDESRTDVEGDWIAESRSSKAQNTRLRMTTKTSLEESPMYDEKTVAVTTQESLVGIREKAMRIASIGELKTGSSAERWSSPG